jgi:hypothetical protein
MAIYFLQDIECTDDGDLVLDSIGDLKTASPMRTVAQSVNSLVMTDKGDLRVAPSYGANIGAYIGSRNSTMTRSMMGRDINNALMEQGLLAPVDFTIEVIPVDIDKVAVMLDVNGSFVYSPENYRGPLLSDRTMGINMAYIYPFSEGQIKRATS